MFFAAARLHVELAETHLSLEYQTKYFMYAIYTNNITILGGSQKLTPHLRSQVTITLPGQVANKIFASLKTLPALKTVPQ